MTRVLIVDDHPKNIQVLGNILSTEDYEIEFALDGFEAVKRVEDEDFDIILMDIMMPVMDGFEASKRIKQIEGKDEIPIIFITAKADEDSMKKGFSIGAIDYITKPFNSTELHSKVKVHVELKQSKDALKKFNEELEFKVKERTKSLIESNEKLKNLNIQLTRVEEEERKRIAENLHDTLGQTLSMAYMKLSMFKPNGSVNGVEIIEEVSALLNEAITESRTITYDLSPPVLYELGLIAAFKWKLEQVGTKHEIRTNLRGEEVKISIQKDFEIFLYRIVSELLANIIKHAQAKSIEIDVTKTGELYEIVVSDDGVGFDTEKNIVATESGGFGLSSIVERLERMNGYLKIESEINKGTKAKIILQKNQQR